MKTIELFCGTKSFSNVAQKLGHSILTIDNNPIFKSDICDDVISLKINDKFDVVWASPPCQAFSVAAIGRNWKKKDDKYLPTSDRALLGLELLRATLKHIKNINPKFWFIENPRGMMRKIIDKEFELAGIHDYRRVTISYCQYNNQLVQELIFKMSNKKCPCCGEIKEIENFYKNKSRRDGFSSWCKLCDNNSHKNYVINNNEYQKTYDRQYYKEHREIKLEQKQKYYIKNIDNCKLSARKYRLKNLDIIKQKEKIYYIKNKDRKRLINKLYYINNSEAYKVRARNRKFKLKNISDNTITQQNLNQMYEIQNHKCAYCGCDLDKCKKHLDHILPISRGGLHTLKNVHWVCSSCNLDKRDKTEEEWLIKERMKPTDIWTNLKSWEGKLCKPKASCHVAAPRGSLTGTQGLKNPMLRGIIPSKLFYELFEKMEESK